MEVSRVKDDLGSKHSSSDKWEDFDVHGFVWGAVELRMGPSQKNEMFLS